MSGLCHDHENCLVWNLSDKCKTRKLCRSLCVRGNSAALYCSHLGPTGMWRTKKCGKDPTFCTVRLAYFVPSAIASQVRWSSFVHGVSFRDVAMHQRSLKIRMDGLPAPRPFHARVLRQQTTNQCLLSFLSRLVFTLCVSINGSFKIFRHRYSFVSPSSCLPCRLASQRRCCLRLHWCADSLLCPVFADALVWNSTRRTARPSSVPWLTTW
jgi:hypothetical protein